MRPLHYHGKLHTLKGRFLRLGKPTHSEQGTHGAGMLNKSLTFTLPSFGEASTVVAVRLQGG